MISMMTMAVGASATAFLGKAQLSQAEVKDILLSEMAGRTDVARLTQIEDELRPMFSALPKGENGRLEQSTVRYALHRYFLQKYGWYVQGLDNAGEVWNASSASTVLKAFAPVYIQSLFEEQLNGNGMGLHELAVFAATMADLVHMEAVGDMQQIFATLQLPTLGPVVESSAEEALDTFVTAFLSMVPMLLDNLTDIEVSKELLEEAYPNLEETKTWWQDFRLTYELSQSSRRNPFVQQATTFDKMTELALEFSHGFSSFQNLECHTLKRKLVDMEHLGTGRVLLSQFYRSALDGAWEFKESVEYLRNQGSLDESNPDSPSVVIPNYVNSRMNCLTASDFYAVCCLSECDGLMGKVEANIMAPSETPARIIEVISKLQSDTVDAPRNISTVLTARLEGIAHNHGGQVPLHGRLFSQWMHHVYPRECPFPHVSGAVTPMYPEEWAELMGEDMVEVTEEVMEAHAKRLAHAQEKIMDLPWTRHEELVAVHRQGASKSRISSMLKPAMAMLGLVSFAVPLARALNTAISTPTEGKFEQQLV